MPVYLEKTGRYDELLSYLSYEHFAKLIDLVQSLGPLQQQLDLGVVTAVQLGRDRDLVRLSLESATLEQFSQSATWRPEIEARAALDDFDGACSIAQSIPLREDRFHAFAVIARKSRESGNAVRADVADQIKALYEELDRKRLGEKALDIASDLIFSFHDLAIELVESAADVSKGDDALDWSLANLTVAALKASASEHEPLNLAGTDATERIKSKVHDPKVQNFISTASLLFKETPATLAIREAEKIESAGDRLFLLRQWTKNNRSRPDAPEVIEYALKLAIGTTPYTFNATVLRELALPLPEVQDLDRLRKLMGLVESQVHTAETLGPTEDYVRLQLLLARAEARTDRSLAHERMIDIFLEVSYLGDLETKAACFAWILGSLTEIDPERVWQSDGDGNLHSTVRETFDTALNQLLLESANHYEITKGIIRPLARFLPKLGVELAMRLNIAPRRDAALVELFRASLARAYEDIDFVFLYETLANFDDTSSRDYAVGIVMSRLDEVNSAESTMRPGLIDFFAGIPTIASVQEKVLAGARAYRLFVAHGGDEKTSRALLDNATSEWKKENQGWHRLTLGFQMAAIVARVNRTEARKIFDTIDGIRQEIPMDSGSTVQAYSLSVRLAVRALHGLLRHKQFAEERLWDLQRLIEVIPSDGDQAILYSEISLIFRFNDEDTWSRRIVDEKVRPKIDQIDDRGFRNEVIVHTAPALYLSHSPTALELISSLPQDLIDDAISNITSTVLTKTVVSEPYDFREGQGFELSHPEIVDLCTLADLIDSDSQLYGVIRAIANSIVQNRNRISRSQIAQVLSDLQRIINAKLPNPRHIRHEGYKIIAETELAKLKEMRRKDWENIVERARQIPNTADRAFTLAQVGENIPPKEKDLKRSVFREAKALIATIPALYDRIDRYKILAEFNFEKDEALSRECLTEAFSITLGTNDTQLLSRQRKLVDLPFRIDPAFAASMSALIDDDPAKRPMRHMLNQQIEAARLEKRISEAKRDQSSLSQSDQRNAPGAAWKNLGSLNAGRIVTQHPENLRELLRAVHKMPMSRAYPVFSYFMQNTVMRSSSANDPSSLASALFDSSVQNCRLSGLIASRSAETFRKSLTYSSLSRSEKDYVVGSGTRKEVIDFLKRWSSQSLGDYIKIADPFFGADDLDLLQLITEAQPTCKIWVLTSQKHNHAIWDTLKDSYTQRWRSMFNQEPPDAEIVFVGLENTGSSPIHDRWWITGDQGLRLGTSYNSLGDGKISEISRLDEESSASKEVEINKYLFRIVREHQGKKVTYRAISFDK